MSPGTTDYYELLGVGRDASADEIKKAFRRLAREHHPDVAEHHDAEERFKAVNEAYEVLSDPEKRATYDRFGTADPRMAGGGADFGDVFGFGVDDVFSMFFGGGMGAQRVRREGRDMAAQVSVTLQEAATGVDRELRLVRVAPCPTCEGAGAEPGGTVIACPECGGTGQRRVIRRTILGSMESVAPCERCGATGELPDPPCHECGGSGRVRATEMVTVPVPAGVQDGMQVRIPGYGEAGLRGARSGDLIVGVTVEPHEFLHREGDDLHGMASVSITQAALGATISVPGLFDPVEVKVPAGSQHGDRVIVRDHGMPRRRGGSGDLVVHLGVKIPAKLGKKERELLEQLAETLDAPKKGGAFERLRDWLGG